MISKSESNLENPSTILSIPEDASNTGLMIRGGKNELFNHYCWVSEHSERLVLISMKTINLQMAWVSIILMALPYLCLVSYYCYNEIITLFITLFFRFHFILVDFFFVQTKIANHLSGCDTFYKACGLMNIWQKSIKFGLVISCLILLAFLNKFVFKKLMFCISEVWFGIPRPSELFYSVLTPLLTEAGLKADPVHRSTWPVYLLKKALSQLTKQTPNHLLSKYSILCRFIKMLICKIF